MSESMAPRPATSDERKGQLAMAVSREVSGFDGWRVESQSDYQVVLYKGKRVSHVLHLILTCFTFGFWIPVWAWLVFMNRRQTLILTVDEYGNVRREV